MSKASATVLNVFLLLFFAVSIASANTLTITKTEDTADGVCDADCSLREAVIAAVAGDIITFSSLFDVPQTITLSGGEILIDKSLAISGSGASLLSISGNDASRIFKITNAASVVMSSLRLRNGSPADKFGGAITVASSSLELSNMIFNDNGARLPTQSFGSGGAIYGFLSTIVVRDVEFYNNGGTNGAATYTDGGSITMLRVTVRNNTGSGAKANTGSAVEAGSSERMDIDDSRIISNIGTGVVSTGITKISNSLIADNLYGGIASLSGSTQNISLEIDHCIVRNNKRTLRLADSGGGIISSRFATIRSTVVSGNRAVSSSGGIKNNGTMYIYDSAIVDNYVGVNLETGGGGISTAGDLFLINSTVSGNFARGTGGGIYAWSVATVNIINSTVVSNSVMEGAGGGLRRDGNSVVHIRNSIFANNTSQGAGPDIWGPVISEGFNLIRNPAGSSGWASTDLIKQDPLLAPLGSNGGGTFTYALIPGSPAINAGSNALAVDPQTMQPLKTDQRGSLRFVGDKTPIIDIGAYEANYSPSPVTLVGRVLNSSGGALPHARVALSTGAGEIRYAVTNPFGYYRFKDLFAGITYTLTASDKLYSFAVPLTVTADQDRDDLIFLGSF